MNKETLYLDSLTLQDIEKVRKWRNEASKNGVYRTPFLLTEKMQLDFFNNVVNNRNSNNRYFAVKFPENNEYSNLTIGIVGLTNIQWENKLAEVALTLNDKFTGKGYGEKSLVLILTEGFENLGLLNIYGECYYCNPNFTFWEKMCLKYDAYKTILPDRKFFKGNYHNSMYFNFNEQSFVNSFSQGEKDE